MYEIGDFPSSPAYAQGWTCPKCGRVYSPMTYGCFFCNQQYEQKSTTKLGTTSEDPNNKAI